MRLAQLPSYLADTVSATLAPSKFKSAPSVESTSDPGKSCFTKPTQSDRRKEDRLKKSQTRPTTSPNIAARSWPCSCFPLVYTTNFQMKGCGAPLTSRLGFFIKTV